MICVAARADRVGHHVHLRRLVAVREDQAQRRLVRRDFGLIRAGHGRNLRARTAVDRQRVEMPLAGMLFARGDVELLAVAGNLRRRDLPFARSQLNRLCAFDRHVERVEVHPAVALGEEPDAFVVGQELDGRRPKAASAAFPHPRIVVQQVDDARLARFRVERDVPPILVLRRARRRDHVLPVVGDRGHRPADIPLGGRRPAWRRVPAWPAFRRCRRPACRSCPGGLAARSFRPPRRSCRS